MDDAEQCTQDCFSSAASMLQTQKVNRGPGMECLGECFDTEGTCMDNCSPGDHACEKSCMGDAQQCTQDCFSSAASMLQTRKGKRGPGMECLGGCFDTEGTCMDECSPGDHACKKS